MSNLIDLARRQFPADEWALLPVRVRETISAGRGLADIVAGHKTMRYRMLCTESQKAEYRLATGLDPGMAETLQRIAGKRTSGLQLNKTELLCLFLSDRLSSEARP